MLKPLGVMTLFLSFLVGCSSTEVQHLSAFDRPSISGQMENNVDESLRLRNMALDKILESAKELLDEDNYGMAQVYYSAALGRDPNSVAALKGLGMVAYQQHSLDEAAEALEQALKLSPDDIEALLSYGQVLRAYGLLEEAAEPLLHALELEPDNAVVLQELAINLEAAGRLDEADGYFQKAVQKSPRSATAFNNLGFHYLMRGYYLMAAEVLVKALRITPQSRRTRNNLAVARAMLGDYKGALRLFTETMGAAAAHNNLGYLHMVKGDLGKSKTALEQALSKSPSLYVRAMENRARLMGLATGSNSQ